MYSRSILFGTDIRRSARNCDGHSWQNVSSNADILNERIGTLEIFGKEIDIETKKIDA